MEAPGSVKCAELCDPLSGCRLCPPTGSRAQQEASPPPPAPRPPGPARLCAACSGRPRVDSFLVALPPWGQWVGRLVFLVPAAQALAGGAQAWAARGAAAGPLGGAARGLATCGGEACPTLLQAVLAWDRCLLHCSASGSGKRLLTALR